MKNTMKSIRTIFCSAIVVFTLLVVPVAVSAQSSTALSSESQLQQIADTLAIQQLLAKYMNFMDASDYESYSKLFNDDGELIFQSFDLKGPQAIREMMGRGSQAREQSDRPPRILRHTMSNSLIEINGDTATHTARWITMSAGADGKPVIGGTGLYQDLLRKVDGAWKIQRRVITNDIPYVKTKALE